MGMLAIWLVVIVNWVIGVVICYHSARDDVGMGSVGYLTIGSFVWSTVSGIALFELMFYANQLK